MSLRQIIKRKKILETIATGEMTLPGEPMIYSIKYSLGSRTRSVQFFRNSQFKSMLKSHFSSYYNTKTPVVIIVRFYVSPSYRVNISSKRLKEEKTPAVDGYEINDYILSFCEMLHKVLINSYRQIVKIEADKFYSNDPRTVFKFMSWENYEKLQTKDSIHSKGKSIGKAREIWQLQPESERDADAKGICKGDCQR